ncbi:M16 family metallopeptidase [Cognatilysobacter tabacisoli]|uniref:M16 family metallopeptidase n=1 Tax=Cognatilysobacter tabacisoli TaxID=2315424 RepID=UPI001E4AA3E8|nr:pitrilysin family protein [Lysobacter tabacisoli]
MPSSLPSSPSLPRALRTGALALACALALASPAAIAADGVAPPKGVAAGPCVEGICEYTLANGLRVLLFPDASKPTVTVNLAYGVGSVHENYGETGMAHLLEHLLFKGTPTHADIPGEFKKRGISANATTSLDRTNYYGSFPENVDTLDWLLGLEADRMVNSFVAKKDLDSEMTVVRNEMERNENSPNAVTLQRLRSTAYLWHNYGNSTIGARSDVENVPIERLQGFYRTHYRPDNATLIVAGRIDPADTLARVNRHFGRIKRPAQPLPAYYTDEPTQDGEREVTVRRSGDVRLAALGYHVPGATHPDTPALEVLLNILGDTPTGRLHKALVDTKLAAGAGAGNGAMRTRGLATLLLVAPKDADIAKAEAELLRQAESLAERPVTGAEVEQAKQRFANAYETGFTNVNAVAMGLTESVADGDWRLYFLQRDAIAKVTAADVNRVAATYLRPSNRTLARFIPTDSAQRAEITAAPAPADALKGYTGRAAVAAGEAFDPTPANIDARTQTFTLGSGLKVSLLPKDTRGDTVVVNATFRFGDVESLKRSPDPAGSMAGALLMRGTTTLSREQIAQRLEALKTTGGVSGGLQSASINLSGKRETLADALALAADVLRNPSFPEAEFEQLRLQSITGLEAARKEPGTVAGQAMGEHFDPWPSDHPLAHKSIDESLARVRALKRDDVVAFHRDFYGTANGEIVVVGDFDPAAVKAQLETLFAGWASPKPYAPIRTRHNAVAAEVEMIETPDKANAVVVARTNLALSDADPDYPALVVANHVLGSGALASRLGDRLRQKDGLTYGVSSALNADASPDGRDDAGSLGIQAIAAPQNVPRLVAGMNEEVQRWARDGITATELSDAVANLLTQRSQSRAADANVSAMLARNLYLGRTMAWTAEFEARLKALTVDEVNAAIRRHVKPETISVYAAGDFAKAAAGAAATGAK